MMPQGRRRSAPRRKQRMQDLGVRIGEINIVCSDAARALRFYRDLLGFQVLGEEEGCWHLACGDVRFLLLPFAVARTDTPAYGAEPCVSVDLVVDDLTAARTRLAAAGVAILSDPAPDDVRFFIRDPDGLVLEVMVP